MNDRFRDTDYKEVNAWRRPAPLARRAAMACYGWQSPGWSLFWAIAASTPFLAAAVFAPALLSLSPTVDMIAPIAEARAALAGQVSLADLDAPFYALLLMVADMFADTPGRIHLIAKAMAAALVVYPMAYFASSRFPALQTILLVTGFTAYVASPFAGVADFGLAILLTCALVFVSASADFSKRRARAEGILAGAGLFSLWMMSPAMSLAGFAALSACPFLSGRRGLYRYGAALGGFAVLALIAEYFVPGLNLARAAAASAIFDRPAGLGGGEAAIGLSGVAVSAGVVMLSAAIFGGREHVKSWAAAAGLILVAFGAARISGANGLPVFIMAASLACFSVASPFYDGLFRSHDRASVSVALTAASLTLFWAVALIVHSAGQFSLQLNVAKQARSDIRAELGLVQPGGPSIAKWIEEGRFSTPEAREFLALAPVDQSVMLLEAASRARAITDEGLNVAFLTGSDTACVLAHKRDCRADGPAAANAANVVFVPRLEMGPASAAAKNRMEALLYTEFKLIERTALWEIWLRRGAAAPSTL